MRCAGATGENEENYRVIYLVKNNVEGEHITSLHEPWSATNRGVLSHGNFLRPENNATLASFAQTNK